MRLIVLLLTFCFSLVSYGQKHSFRGAWIATVAQIDFPIRNDYKSESQKASMVRMLDSLKMLNFNAIIFQIRPCADALYNSEFEPWSQFLTGTQGVAPDPFYDPLEFMIEEAHKRCIDVHVWLNPYRVTMLGGDINKLSKDHIYFRKPELIVKYNNQYYFDPGYTETREILNNIVADIVSRYDIDAIHMDDYFYPYPKAGIKFPDDRSFHLEPRGFGANEKGDWRRNNVNLIIQELQETIKSIKPYVEFGISPFGIWRNQNKDPQRGSATIGLSNYDDLYADILKWLEFGWIDYVVPQLYWEIGKKHQDYNLLLNWWSDNTYGRNLYAGHYTSLLGVATAREAWRNGNEIIRQIKLNRLNSDVQGEVMYSTRPMLKNPQGIIDSLQVHYCYPALLPISANAKQEYLIEQPEIDIEWDESETNIILYWDRGEYDSLGGISNYVVYRFDGYGIGDYQDVRNIYKITTDNQILLDSTTISSGSTFVVTAINRFKQESKIEKGLYIEF